ncbi:MAG: hypothetical protein IT198_07555 [Acidimicrobiia bacterium]|nr:hypothetical protein [Acidimicrobiia bacterium]
MRTHRRCAVVLCAALLLGLAPAAQQPASAQSLGIITGIRGTSGDPSGQLSLDVSCFFICVGSFRVVTGSSMLNRIVISGTLLGGASGSTPGAPVNLNGILVYLAAQDEPFPLTFPALTGAKAQIIDETVGTFKTDLAHVTTVNVYGAPGTYRGPVHAEKTDASDPGVAPFTVTRM